MRSAIFDLDGTLADTSGDLIAAANACFAARGVTVRLDPVTDAGTALRGGRAMLRLGYGRLGEVDEELVDADYPRLLAAYEAGIAERTRLYPGVVAALDDLAAAGWLLGVCTNKPERLARILLGELGVLDRFAALLGADTLPVRKPDPLHYTRTVEGVGGSLGKSVLIGDSVTDRDTARNAGVPVVLVGFGPAAAQMPALEPDAILDSFANLTRLLDGLIPLDPASGT
ncbi:MAG: HAD hydrolase-like protein [Pseudomonadota bacterium]